MRNKSSFTLIELLVVITIIAILASMLLPGLKGARDKAKQSACLNNLRQIFFAVLMYAQEWDEYYPYGQYDQGGNNWTAVSAWNRITPYVNNTNVFVCPGDPDPNFSGDPSIKNTYGASYADAGRYDVGYGFWRSVNAVPQIRKVGSVSAPSETVYAADTYLGYSTIFCFPEGETWLYLGYYHSGGINVLFADGHVGWYSEPLPISLGKVMR